VGGVASLELTADRQTHQAEEEWAKNELDSLDGLAERVNWLLPVSRRDVNARNVPDFEP
jgi:hypothetical protein